MSQERYDIQHTVRVLATYMAKPTKTSMCAIKKLANYLLYSKDMKMHYPKVGLHETTFQRWYGGNERRDAKQYMLELYSDSDWATCQISRRSTSSGLIYLNGCLIHSHSRSQTSVSLSSMEAEILAATSLLTEAIYVKQVLQFLIGDKGGLGSQEHVMMRLRLDSTSAQAFFARLGPGRAKHLSTRLLWTQSAMRKQWFFVDRISTKENPADLNTKPLSKERREFLMVRLGLQSSNFNGDEIGGPFQGKKRQLVKLLVNMVMASNLQGCGTHDSDGNSTSWRLTWEMMVIIFLLAVIGRLFWKLKSKMEELRKYQEVWKTIKDVAQLKRGEDPFCSEGGDVEREHGEEGEEECGDADETVSDEENPSVTPFGDIDRSEETSILRLRRVCHDDPRHGAADDAADGDVPEQADEEESLKKKERALTPNTRDTCNPQWKKFQMWMNGPTFIMAMRIPMSKIQNKMKTKWRLQLQDRDQEGHVQKIQNQNQKQCLSLLHEERKVLLL